MEMHRYNRLQHFQITTDVVSSFLSQKRDFIIVRSCSSLTKPWPAEFVPVLCCLVVVIQNKVVMEMYFWGSKEVM